jgi:cytoskeletal protein CcmA (bactofilin family)
MWNQSNTPNTPTTAPKQPVTNGQTTALGESPLVRTSLAAGSASAEQGAGATIGKSLVVKGEISGSESLYVDGRVEGTINLPGNRVTVGRNGQVSANITAREIIVQGKLAGNVNASDRLDVRSEGSLTGDVVAQRISVEDGAFFKGKIDIRRPSEKMTPGSETKEAMPSEEASTKIA